MRYATIAHMSSERARYSHAVKQQVRERYPLCRTTRDKEGLATELGIGSVAKLYNLASRLGATGKKEAENVSKEKANESDRLKLREDPESVDWTSSADKYLMEEFGRRTVEAIAFHLHHTETAVMYHARNLGLRKPAKHWNITKVAAWLGIDEDEIRKLDVEGIMVYPLYSLAGKLVLEVVSTTSLGRWFRRDGTLKKLAELEADKFFILEIQETLQDIIDQKTDWELCKFLSHGHVCMNPYTMAAFGLYCTNTERQLAGDRKGCKVRYLEITDIRPG